MHNPVESRSDARTRPRDPRVAFLVMVAVVVASLLVIRQSRGMLVLGVFVCAWHAVVTGRLAATARSLLRLLPFALVIIVLNAVLVPGDALVTIAGRRVISRPGLEDGVFFALRLVVLLMAVAAWVGTASPEAMARSAYDAVRRVSARAASNVALFVFMSMGFVPLAADEFQRIRVAQSFRGGRLEGGLWRRAETARAWLVPLLVSTIHRSGQLAMTVELRDIRARLPRTIEPPRFAAADAMLAAAAVAVVWLAST